MSQDKGYYSLIQYCPDPSRLEGVNVGVVLYSLRHGTLRVEMSRSNTRIRKILGDQNWDYVNRAKRSVESQLKSQTFPSVEDLESYISKRANVIQMTPLRAVRIDDFDKDLTELCNRLVGHHREESKPRVNGYLTRRLVQAGVANLVEKSISIEIPEVSQSIHAPYGYQNGHFNLISPVQFDSSFEKVIEKTGKSTLESKLLHEHPHPRYGQMRLVVVANFDDNVDNAMRGFVQKTLTESEVRLYSFENIEPLVDDIRRSAESHSQEQRKLD